MLVIFSFIAAALLMGALDESPLLGGVIGALLAWVYGLSQRVQQLEQAQRHPAPPPQPVSEHPPAPIVASPPKPTPLPTTFEPSRPLVPPLAAPVPAAPAYRPPEGNALDKAFASAWSWLTGGNPFVRVGIILLFIGVVFLMRYSLEQGLLPVELRLLGAATGAFALLGYGWKLRNRSGAYGLILQAGGIGLLYLTVFAAFSLYQLVPAPLAFAVLLLIVVAATVLAVKQDSLPLAAFAATGGFLAPLLTSTGSNNYIGLFSFYALLNAGIVAVAWFKTWRLLNLLGFVFTFVIAVLWGWFSYQPENFATTEPFLILFFLFYLAIAVLFATRTPVNFKDKVDSTLVFGTPILGFLMQTSLVREFEYGIALSAAGMGLFYLAVCAGLWRRFGKQQQLLMETFLALGVVFLTLAIPFAVDGIKTATAWAVEGVGILWVSIRQQQPWRRVFAVLLQLASLIALLLEVLSFTPPDLSDSRAFLNGEFLSVVLVSAALLIASRLLSDDFDDKRDFEQPVATVLFFAAWLFLSLLFEKQIGDFRLHQHITALHLGYATVIGISLSILARFKLWSLSPYLLPMALLLVGLAILNVLGDNVSITVGWEWLAWAAAFISLYLAAFRLQQRGWFTSWLHFTHVALLWLGFTLLSHELSVQVQTLVAVGSTWDIASLPLIGVVMLGWLVCGTRWPLPDYATSLLHFVAFPMAGILGLWVLISLHNNGATPPTTWIPLLNPLDVVTLVIAYLGWQLYQHPEIAHSPANTQLLRYTGVGLAFLWANTLILRAQHHWNGLAWAFPDLLLQPSTQTLLAIAWTLGGMALTWQANRLGKRKLWVFGAVLLGAVVLKLFVVDFAASGTVARIVSFLSVGVLLLFIGYLAPLPPAEQAIDKSTD